MQFRAYHLNRYDKDNLKVESRDVLITYEPYELEIFGYEEIERGRMVRPDAHVPEETVEIFGAWIE